MKIITLKQWISSYYYKKYFSDEEVILARKRRFGKSNLSITTSLKTLMLVTEKVNKELKRLKL